jgi:hypothetical protein
MSRKERNKLLEKAILDTHAARSIAADVQVGDGALGGVMVMAKKFKIPSCNR